MAAITEADGYEELVDTDVAAVAEVAEPALTKTWTKDLAVKPRKAMDPLYSSLPPPKVKVDPIRARYGYGRVYVKASVNGNEAMALLDTGATLSVIS